MNNHDQSGLRGADLERLLADPAVWVEPPTGLQDRIVGAISAAAPPASRRRNHWLRVTLLGVAAGVLLTTGLAIGAARDGHRSVDYTASLSGTSLAPNVAGEAKLTRFTSGWQVYLHAKGLPRLDDGAFYEAWLKSDSGAVVAIGTFNDADDVTLWAGVAPSDYPILTVTRQTTGGGAASSGKVVLTGSARPAQD